MDQFDDTVTRVIGLLKSSFGTEFKKYYDGEPDAIPLFDLPCIVVTQTTDDTAEAQQGEDDVTDHITVKVVLNKADDWDGDKVSETNTTESRIRAYIAKRDPETGNYGERTVKGILRQHLLKGVLAQAPQMDVEYGINRRVAPTSNYVDETAEGHVTFDVTYSVDTYQ